MKRQGELESAGQEVGKKHAEIERLKRQIEDMSDRVKNVDSIIETAERERDHLKAERDKAVEEGNYDKDRVRDLEMHLARTVAYGVTGVTDKINDSVKKGDSNALILTNRGPLFESSRGETKMSEVGDEIGKALLNKSYLNVGGFSGRQSAGSYGGGVTPGYAGTSTPGYSGASTIGDSYTGFSSPLAANSLLYPKRY